MNTIKLPIEYCVLEHKNLFGFIDRNTVSYMGNVTFNPVKCADNSVLHSKKPFDVSISHLSFVFSDSLPIDSRYVQWYGLSTPEMRVEIVNETLRDLGWYLNTNELFNDEVVCIEYMGMTASAYYHANGSYRWFCAYVNGIEVLSRDFRGIHPNNVSDLCRDFNTDVLYILQDLYKAHLLDKKNSRTLGVSK